MPDSSEKQIGFTSRTLTTVEKKYSQLEEEALACVYGVKRFNSYLLGHHFKCCSPDLAYWNLKFQIMDPSS